MPGSGVNIENVLKFKKAGFSSIHMSATIKKQVLSQKPKVAMHSDAFFEEGIIATSGKETIQKNDSASITVIWPTATANYYFFIAIFETDSYSNLNYNISLHP